MIEATDTPQRQSNPSELPPAHLAPSGETEALAEMPMRARLKRLALSRLAGIWRMLPGWLVALALRLRMTRVSVGVCALVRNEQGWLLVVHHTYRKDPWGLPGGLIGRGEHPDAALARELREELGVEASIDALVRAETWPPGQHLTLYYAATLPDAPVVDGVEIDDWRYVTPDEARLLLGPAADLWLAALSTRQAS
jgi:8-oxo-dGTP pyrophosphatase MutT (NUDIX family)